MDIHPGEFVYATKGRDKGKCFLVIASADSYVYLADGKRRKVSNPKKKKSKHVESSGIKDDSIAGRLKDNNVLTNKQIRCLLRKFLGNASEQNC